MIPPLTIKRTYMKARNCLIGYFLPEDKPKGSCGYLVSLEGVNGAGQKKIPSALKN